MSGKERDQHSGTETTGHQWDGIKELNTPLPRWWLFVFYACIVWAAGYWIVMPAWPTLNGYTKGILHYSQREDVVSAVAVLKLQRHAQEVRLGHATLQLIQNDPDLQQFALAEGHSLFGDNCAPCHGSGGQGARGYPNLNDDVWLWGGRLTDIQHTILVGVRSTSPQTRQSQMPSFGRDKILSDSQIGDLTEYVVAMSGRVANRVAVRRAAKLYDDNCAACHGAKGLGDRSMGTPNLTDVDWLYGSERSDIRDQIFYGHGGVMPAWAGRLSPEEIQALAVYVHSLGGGE